MAVNPPIQQPMIGPDGRVTPVWNQFFLRLSQQIGLSGYMLKATYDPSGSGSVVDSDRLGGELPSYYLDLANHTGAVGIGSVAWNVRALSADDTANTGDLCDVDASGGAVSITLPDPTANTGLMVAVAKADSSANAVTVVGTVNGATDPSFNTQYTCYLMVSNGSEWRRLIS